MCMEAKSVTAARRSIGSGEAKTFTLYHVHDDTSAWGRRLLVSHPSFCGL